MKFLATFVLTVLLFAGAYGVLAFTVNPRGDFPTDLFPNLLVNSLQQKTHLFHAFQADHRIEGLLLGSSRSEKMRPETFSRAYNREFFNFGVANSHMEDLLFVYEWVRLQEIHPKFVIVGVDVEALHGDDRSDLKADQLAMLRKPTSARSGDARSLLQHLIQTADTVNSAFTLSYIDDMVRSIKIKADLNRNAHVRQEFDRDGFIQYPEYEAQRRAGTFHLDAEIDHVEDSYILRFIDMKRLSARRMGYLEQLITETQKDGGQVILWITPIHPRIVAHLNRATPYPKRLQEVREYLQQLHNRYGVVTYDCSEIARFGGTETDWYDGAHVDDSNAARIMKVILGRK